MYILNEIPVKTTNNFNINNIKVDLDIPTNLDNNKFITKNVDDISVTYSKITNFKTNIGLDLESALNIDINIEKSVLEPIEFTYIFDDDNLADNININCSKGVNANLIFKYVSNTDNKNFHHLKQVINLDNNSNVTISVINLLNKNSVSLIASESNLSDYAVLNQYLFDIGGNIKIDNYESKTAKYAESYLKNIYLGNSNDIIDMNYHYLNIGNNSITNIESQGVLNDKASKNFRGTIDFISGCSKSIGKENENCVLLSDSCKSRSVPLLLCGEEDVEGAHSVSSGKIDSDKLFYITSRGISEEDAKKMIIMSNFNKIIDEINNENISQEILSILDKSI